MMSLMLPCVVGLKFRLDGNLPIGCELSRSRSTLLNHVNYQIYIGLKYLPLLLQLLCVVRYGGRLPALTFDLKFNNALPHRR